MKTSLLSKSFTALLFLSCISMKLFAVGDTTVVQVFRFDTTMRAGVFLFPDDTTKTYEKIIMLYSMRCKNGLVSNSQYPNQGCGEWDYNCYTYIVDSAQVDSLKTRHNSHDISNFSGSVYNYTSVPVWRYIQYTQQEITYTSVISETTGTVGNGTANLNHPLGVSQVSRSQYLFTAAELSSAGITAGNITGLRLDVFSLGNAVNNLRIKLKPTTQNILDANAPELTGFTETYFLNTTISSTGIHSCNFHTPFNWDGTSNVIVEFSYTNVSPGTDNVVNAHDAGFAAGLTNTAPDSYLNLNGSLQYVDMNNSFFNSISNEVTVAFWSYGNAAVLPANTTIMEAVDSANRRQVNIHLPWSDSNVYWDCGNDGSNYDRINAVATPANFEGKWTHWAFTKNTTTGVMNIYMNGTLFATGSNKTKPINNIQKWLVGLAWNGSVKYFGDFDELSVWNKALSQASVQQLMYSDITAAHPDYSNLQAYYKFNEGTGIIATDSGPNGFNSDIINPTWHNHRGHSLYRNFTSTTFRPNTIFVQGTYTTSVQTTTVLDSFPLPATSVISYNVVNNTLNVIDTIYVWNSGYAYVYDATGALVDSVPVPTQNTINVTTLMYYPRRPMQLELINFITPYGLGLNMNGLIGKTWAFDVTDYTPILKGARFIAMEGAPYQEDNDIRFVFYEGTPPRDVKSISQIWPNGTWVAPSYNDIVSNNYFEPVTFQLSNAASQYKIRSAISGHGQEGEFVPRTHTITLNGSMNFPWQLTKKCSDNPIYPQGGTWIFEREGWCPGAEVDNKNLELTPNVTSGQTITLDYSLPSIANPGSSNYRVNHQLVSYGAPNFTLDAAVDYIKSPSKRTEYSRFNPICNEPVIAIKNTGSTTLTSLDITYGRVGGTMANYQWTGTLDFLESAEIVLPQPDWLSSGQNSFVVRVSNPNGGADLYAQNDTLYSDFDTPAMHQGDLVFELRTNNWGYQNRYTLTNSNGDTIIYHDFLANNSFYRDTILLPNDCYTVYMQDDGGEGLSFWFFSSQQGSGYFRIKKPTGQIIKTFNADFGDNIYYQFTVGYAVDVAEPQVNSIENFNVYPNPAADMFAAEFSLPQGSNAVVSLINPVGQTVLQEKVSVTQSVEKVYFDVDGIETGIYFVSVQSGHQRQMKKLVITR